MIYKTIDSMNLTDKVSSTAYKIYSFIMWVTLWISIKKADKPTETKYNFKFGNEGV